MTDFETHPVSTADLLKRLRSNTPNMAIGLARHQAAARIEQLEAELTRANAATAAAFEVAAQKVFTDQWPNYGDAKRVSENIRAFATPDQTAALDRMIAEAVEPYVDALIWCSGSADFNEGGFARGGWQKLCAPLIMANIETGNAGVIESLHHTKGNA